MHLNHMRIRSDSELERLSQLKQEMEDGENGLNSDSDPRISGIVMQMRE